MKSLINLLQRERLHRYSHLFGLICCVGVLSLSCVDRDADSPNLFDYTVGEEGEGGVSGDIQTAGISATEFDDMEVPTAGTVSFTLPTEVSVATYNVQNLFDFVNDPDHDEGEFTPNVSQWSRSTYEARIRSIASAIKLIDADLVTLQEVESEAVLIDLTQEIVNQGGRNYPYIAVSSTRDPRGIALGVISIYPFSREIGRPISTAVTCQNGELLNGSRPEARPIYEINLWSDGSGGGGGGGMQSLTLLVNHWKSRASGDFPCQVSEHHWRGASQIHDLLQTWLDEEPQRSVIVLGDFNAVESESSMSTILDAYLNQAELTGSASLYNLWGELGVTASSSNNATNSTYRYGGDWFRLDHIMVNQPLSRGGSGVWFVTDFELIRDASLLRNGAPYGWQNQNRQGVSDHLPLKVTLSLR